MTPMTPAEKERAAKVAKGLSEAQLAALQYARPVGVHYQFAFEPEDGREVRTGDALVRKGLAEWAGSRGYRAWLTPLGLAVRNHLTEQNQ